MRVEFVCTRKGGFPPRTLRRGRNKKTLYSGTEHRFCRARSQLRPRHSPATSATGCPPPPAPAPPAAGPGPPPPPATTRSPASPQPQANPAGGRGSAPGGPRAPAAPRSPALPPPRGARSPVGRGAGHSPTVSRGASAAGLGCPGGGAAAAAAAVPAARATPSGRGGRAAPRQARAAASGP